MPQIFRPGHNTLSKVSLVAGFVLMLGSFWVLGALDRSPYMTEQRVVRDQPVPFSHQHHAGDLGLDCRYCHFTVERSKFAGIPPVGVCMNCHTHIWADSPMLAPVREAYAKNGTIRWVRVNDLPDFVYFDHSIHVHKGVGCTSCHGRVDRMPLMWKESSLHMEWCLECHRHPESFVRPREAVFRMDWERPADQPMLGKSLVKQYRIESVTDCYGCHR